jgi:hypothetical protein
MFETFGLLLEHGQYYDPAWKHYGKNLKVTCDRCQIGNLPTCIGYEKNDLCLSCYNRLKLPALFNTNGESVTFMETDNFRTIDSPKYIERANGEPVTLMETDNFRTIDSPKYVEKANGNCSYFNPLPSRIDHTLMELDYYNTGIISDVEMSKMCMELKNLYDDPNFDRTVQMVIMKLGILWWFIFMDNVLKKNYFYKLDIDTIYAIKRLFGVIVPTKYAENCEMRIKFQQTAITYKLSEFRTGFSLYIVGDYIGDISYNKNSGMFHYPIAMVVD